ncbi:uncharacterized protein PV06_08222 [Exophiala oligosperma]|uniref:BZIP domain-containing protein n=1 Tax=Exophiala oligosperma TaxID=215243 RepID=A0A0D2DB09_9EURO|nr:uncharacterized protein PV06_08222 [Exophiala oligosperma]KIW39625.1 hypothetical protein PV06_08222 [Exophiala oligosperma]
MDAPSPITGSLKPPPRFASSFTGSVCNGGGTSRSSTRRTGAQLERKRRQDRESQRNARERTKKYIASLEERLAELESPTCISDLSKKNEELRQKVDSLETKLQAVVQIATRVSDTNSGGDHAAEAHHLFSATLAHPHDGGRSSASPASTSLKPTCPLTGAVLREKATSAGPTVQRQSAILGVVEVGKRAQIDNASTAPGCPDNGDAEPMVDFNHNYMQVGDIGPSSHTSTTLPPATHGLVLDSRTSVGSLTTANIWGPTSSLGQHNPDGTPSLDAFYVPPGPLWPEKGFPTPQNCAATNIWDAKLIKCINEHQNHLMEFSMSMPEDPELRSILDPRTSQGTADSLTHFLNAPITQWNFELPEKLAMFWLNFVHLKVSQNRIPLEPSRPAAVQLLYVYMVLMVQQYRIYPSEETFNEMPPWFRPCPLQCQVSHPIYIDALPWPHLREKLTFEHRLYPFHLLTPVFCSSLNINWPHNQDMTYVHEASGNLRLSRSFKKHIRKLENWTMKPAFSKQYPELTWAVQVDNAPWHGSAHEN